VGVRASVAAAAEPEQLSALVVASQAEGSQVVVLARLAVQPHVRLAVAVALV